jgi:arylsulfatase A-like enzyme
MVTRLDGYVGRLMSELEKLGIAQDTLIFFSSDNGAAAKPRSSFMNSTGNLRGFKFSPYEGGLRVPMIVRWPGHVPAKRHRAGRPGRREHCLAAARQVRSR